MRHTEDEIGSGALRFEQLADDLDPVAFEAEDRATVPVEKERNISGMSTPTVRDIYNETARLDIHEVVRRLNAHLGATLVAALTGSKDRKLPYRWAKIDGPAPGTDFERRLRLAHRAWRQIADAESDHVGRAWFIGGNPFLHEDTPLTAIREDRDKEVMDAVTATLDDRQDL